MKQNTIQLIVICIIVCGYTACKDKNTSPRLDLMPYSIPASIDAPNDVTINKLGNGNVTNVAINNNKDYDVQVFMTVTTESNLEKLKMAKKEEVVADPFFIKIIEEGPTGFIFEKSLGMDTDDRKPSYDFRIIEIVGNKTIVYQCGNSNYFSEKEVKMMYQSALPQK